MPMPIWPTGTSALMMLIAVALPARPTQTSWVGLNTVPSATSPVTNGQPRLPAVPNCRKPAAEKPSGPEPRTFSSPAHRKITPTSTRRSATPS